MPRAMLQGPWLRAAGNFLRKCQLRTAEPLAFSVNFDVCVNVFLDLEVNYYPEDGIDGPPPDVGPP